MVKENHNLGLSFAEGFIFFKVKNRELVGLYYDPSQEIGSTATILNIPAATFRDKQLLGSTSLANTTNMFLVSKNFHIYQMFIGVQPSIAKVFIAAENTDQKEIDAGNWGTGSNYRFGYFDGRLSPFDAPGTHGELFVTKDMGYSFAVQNPLPYTISPTFNFVINRLDIAVIKDANIIQKMLQGIVPVRLAPIGGLSQPKYNMETAWKVKPITIDATIDEIKRAVA